MTFNNQQWQQPAPKKNNHTLVIVLVSVVAVLLVIVALLIGFLVGHSQKPAAPQSLVSELVSLPSECDPNDGDNVVATVKVKTHITVGYENNASGKAVIDCVAKRMNMPEDLYKEMLDMPKNVTGDYKWSDIKAHWFTTADGTGWLDLEKA